MKCDVAMPAGARVAYAYTGGKTFDPAQPCVVFLHGALNDHSVWTLAARWFAHHGHAVLAPDLPGHMRSLGPPLAERRGARRLADRAARRRRASAVPRWSATAWDR